MAFCQSSLRGLKRNSSQIRVQGPQTASAITVPQTWSAILGPQTGSAILGPQTASVILGAQTALSCSLRGGTASLVSFTSLLCTHLSMTLPHDPQMRRTILQQYTRSYYCKESAASFKPVITIYLAICSTISAPDL